MRQLLGNLLIEFGNLVGGFQDWEGNLTKAGLQRVREGFNESFDEQMQEAEERKKLGLLEMKCPEHWHSSYYMQQGYLAKPCAESTGHWQGGETNDPNAVCPFCNQRLLLLWDIACRDPRFAQESPELFAGLTRLPLYFCWRCPDATIYQVLPDGSIRMTPEEKVTSEESPFEKLPDALPRTSIHLEPLARDIANLILNYKDFSRQWLNQVEMQRILTYFSVPNGSSAWPRSQFGGSPFFVQGHSDRKCPNEKCLTQRMDHPIIRNQQHYLLKELALVAPDEICDSNAYASVKFLICWKCLTIVAEYECT